MAAAASVAVMTRAEKGPVADPTSGVLAPSPTTEELPPPGGRRLERRRWNLVQGRGRVYLQQRVSEPADHDLVQQMGYENVRGRYRDRRARTGAHVVQVRS